MGKNRPSVLVSTTLTIGIDEHWAIKGAARNYLSVLVADTAAAFEIALTEPDRVPLSDEWISKDRSPQNAGGFGFNIDTGCSSSYHMRDTDSTGGIKVAVISDIKAEFIQLA